MLLVVMAALPQDTTILRRDRATVPSVALANVLRAVDGRASADAMCEALGIDPTLPTQPDTRVPYRQLAELFDAGARRTADPWFGLHVRLIAQVLGAVRTRRNLTALSTSLTARAS